MRASCLGACSGFDTGINSTHFCGILAPVGGLQYHKVVTRWHPREALPQTPGTASHLLREVWGAAPQVQVNLPLSALPPERGEQVREAWAASPGLQGEGNSAPPSGLSRGGGWGGKAGPRHGPTQTLWRRAQEGTVSSYPGGSSESKVSRWGGHSVPGAVHTQAGLGLPAL